MRTRTLALLCALPAKLSIKLALWLVRLIWPFTVTVLSNTPSKVVSPDAEILHGPANLNVAQGLLSVTVSACKYRLRLWVSRLLAQLAVQVEAGKLGLVVRVPVAVAVAVAVAVPVGGVTGLGGGVPVPVPRLVKWLLVKFGLPVTLGPVPVPPVPGPQALSTIAAIQNRQVKLRLMAW